MPVPPCIANSGRVAIKPGCEPVGIVCSGCEAFCEPPLAMRLKRRDVFPSFPQLVASVKVV